MARSGAGDPGAGRRALSAAEFADVAAGRHPVVRELSLELIREDEIPTDWLATTVDCYSTESGYYELAQYGNTQRLKARVNEFVAERLVRGAAGAVLDVGVGDGHRLAAICSLVAQRCGRVPQMYGIELSDRMIDKARGRGVHVVKHDMRHGIPDLGRPLDGVLFLSGDLGYVMDPAGGADLRSRVLDSAHEQLGAGGVVVLELVSRDPRVGPNGADVFHFSRHPSVRDADDAVDLLHGPATWQYIKTFSKAETLALVGSSRFELTASSLRYIVRDSPDVRRIGQFVDDDAIVPEESYRILVSLVK